MARIIILRGVNNCGKTASLRMAYNTVRTMADRIIVGVPRRHRKEVRGAVLEITGVRVGFISLGDLAAILEEWLQELLEVWNCKIIVCASRSRDRTVEYLEGLEEEGHALEWIEKQRVPAVRHDEANRETADEVVEALNRTIAEVRAERRAARELLTA